jgi:hypothetical protein
MSPSAASEVPAPAPDRLGPGVTALEPTDRCHPSGPGMGDDHPLHVTAPGQTERDHNTRSYPDSFRTET